VNRVGIKKDGSTPSKILIDYRFDAENLTYQNGDTTLEWSIQKPSTWGKPFNVRNISGDSIVTISDVELLSGNNFNIYVVYALPLKLKQNEVKNKDAIMIKINTQNLNPGTYIDKIIINKDTTLGFYVRVKVF
jgi:hypothetical protein